MALFHGYPNCKQFDLLFYRFDDTFDVEVEMTNRDTLNYGDKTLSNSLDLLLINQA